MVTIELYNNSIRTFRIFAAADSANTIQQNWKSRTMTTRCIYPAITPSILHHTSDVDFSASHTSPLTIPPLNGKTPQYIAILQLQTHGKGRLRVRGAKCLAFRKASSSTQKNLGQLMSESAQADLAFQM